jgi:hypothetical protein
VTFSNTLSNCWYSSGLNVTPIVGPNHAPNDVYRSIVTAICDEVALITPRFVRKLLTSEGSCEIWMIRP